MTSISQPQQQQRHSATVFTSKASSSPSSSSSLTAVQIPCCLCGTAIFPNAANQCVTCLAQQFHFKDVIQRGASGADFVTIYQCRTCRRYKRTEKHYQTCEPESPELLQLCLKQIPALNYHHHHGANQQLDVSNATPSSSKAAMAGSLQLIDAAWIWTEPHSMRFRIQCTVRAQVLQVPVQQRVVTELRVAWCMCPSCNREFTNRTWHAVVQVRHKRNHTGTGRSSSYSSLIGTSGKGDVVVPHKALAALEMAIANNKTIRKHVLRIDHVRAGFDFYFLTTAHAQAFAAFLQKVAPMRVKTSSKMVSSDNHNNTANMKYTVTCDLVPFCRHDLVLIHKSTTASSSSSSSASASSSIALTPNGTSAGGSSMNSTTKLAGRLALVEKLASTIHLMDASPRRTDDPVMDNRMELSPDTYYKQEKAFAILQGAGSMIRFVVMDVDLCQAPPYYQQQSYQRWSNKKTKSGRKFSHHQHQQQPAIDSVQADDPLAAAVLSSETMEEQLQHGGGGDHDDHDHDHNNDQYSMATTNTTKTSHHRLEMYRKKYALADVQVIRETDWNRMCSSSTGGGGSTGRNNNNNNKDNHSGDDDDDDDYVDSRMASSTLYYHAVTHLGNVLSVGDVVLGYDLRSTVQATTADWEWRSSLQHHYIVPDVVLVQKVHSGGDGADVNMKARNKKKKANHLATTTIKANKVGGAHQDGEQDGEEEVEEEDNDDDAVVHGPADRVAGDEKPAMTKRQQRRLRRKGGGGGKRMQQLEASAARMGFLQDLAEEVEGTEAAAMMMMPINEDDENDDATGSYLGGGFDSDLDRDPVLAAELKALERNFAAMDVVNSASAFNGNILHDSIDDQEEESQEPMP